MNELVSNICYVLMNNMEAVHTVSTCNVCMYVYMYACKHA